MEKILLILGLITSAILVLCFIKEYKYQKLNLKKLAKMWGFDYKNYLGSITISGEHNGYKIVLSRELTTILKINNSSSLKTSLFIESKKETKHPSQYKYLPKNLVTINSNNNVLNKFYTFFSEDEIEAKNILDKIEGLLMNRKEFINSIGESLYIKNDKIEYTIYGSETRPKQLTNILYFTEAITKKIYKT